MVKCPVCKKAVKGVSFRCVGCPKESWVHPKCGGYDREVVSSSSENERNNFQCNNCKKVIANGFNSYYHINSCVNIVSVMTWSTFENADGRICYSGGWSYRLIHVRPSVRSSSLHLLVRLSGAFLENLS